MPGKEKPRQSLSWERIYKRKQRKRSSTNNKNAQRKLKFLYLRFSVLASKVENDINNSKTDENTSDANAEENEMINASSNFFSRFATAFSGEMEGMPITDPSNVSMKESGGNPNLFELFKNWQGSSQRSFTPSRKDRLMAGVEGESSQHVERKDLNGVIQDHLFSPFVTQNKSSDENAIKISSNFDKLTNYEILQAFDTKNSEKINSVKYLNSNFFTNFKKNKTSKGKFSTNYTARNIPTTVVSESDVNIIHEIGREENGVQKVEQVKNELLAPISEFFSSFTQDKGQIGINTPTRISSPATSENSEKTKGVGIVENLKRIMSPIRKQILEKPNSPGNVKSHVGRKSPNRENAKAPVRVKSPSRAKSPSTVTSPQRLKSPISIKSPVRIKSPMRVKSPARVKSPIRAKSPAKINSPLSVKSPARINSPLSVKSPAKAKSPIRVKSPAKVKSPIRVKSPARVESPIRVKSPSKITSPFSVTSGARAKSPSSVKSPQRANTPISVKSPVRIKGPITVKSQARVTTPGSVKSPGNVRSSSKINSPVNWKSQEKETHEKVDYLNSKFFSNFKQPKSQTSKKIQPKPKSHSNAKRPFFVSNTKSLIKSTSFKEYILSLGTRLSPHVGSGVTLTGNEDTQLQIIPSMDFNGPEMQRESSQLTKDFGKMKREEGDRMFDYKKGDTELNDARMKKASSMLERESKTEERNGGKSVYGSTRNLKITTQSEAKDVIVHENDIQNKKETSEKGDNIHLIILPGSAAVQSKEGKCDNIKKNERPIETRTNDDLATRSLTIVTEDSGIKKENGSDNNAILSKPLIRDAISNSPMSKPASAQRSNNTAEEIRTKSDQERGLTPNGRTKPDQVQPRKEPIINVNLDPSNSLDLISSRRDITMLEGILETVKKEMSVDLEGNKEQLNALEEAVEELKKELTRDMGMLFTNDQLTAFRSLAQNDSVQGESRRTNDAEKHDSISGISKEERNTTRQNPVSLDLTNDSNCHAMPKKSVSSCDKKDLSVLPASPPLERKASTSITNKPSTATEHVIQRPDSSNDSKIHQDTLVISNPHTQNNDLQKYSISTPTSRQDSIPTENEFEKQDSVLNAIKRQSSADNIEPVKEIGQNAQMINIEQNVHAAKLNLPNSGLLSEQCVSSLHVLMGYKGLPIGKKSQKPQSQRVKRVSPRRGVHSNAFMNHLNNQERKPNSVCPETVHSPRITLCQYSVPTNLKSNTQSKDQLSSALDSPAMGDNETSRETSKLSELLPGLFDTESSLNLSEKSIKQPFTNHTPRMKSKTNVLSLKETKCPKEKLMKGYLAKGVGKSVNRRDFLNMIQSKSLEDLPSILNDAECVDINLTRTLECESRIMNGTDCVETALVKRLKYTSSIISDTEGLGILPGVSQDNNRSASPTECLDSYLSSRMNHDTIQVADDSCTLASALDDRKVNIHTIKPCSFFGSTWGNFFTGDDCADDDDCVEATEASKINSSLGDARNFKRGVTTTLKTKKPPKKPSTFLKTTLGALGEDLHLQNEKETLKFEEARNVPPKMKLEDDKKEQSRAYRLYSPASRLGKRRNSPIPSPSVNRKQATIINPERLVHQQIDEKAQDSVNSRSKKRTSSFSIKPPTTPSSFERKRSKSKEYVDRDVQIKNGASYITKSQNPINGTMKRIDRSVSPRSKQSKNSNNRYHRSRLESFYEDQKSKNVKIKRQKTPDASKKEDLLKKVQEVSKKMQERSVQQKITLPIEKFPITQEQPTELLLPTLIPNDIGIEGSLVDAPEKDSRVEETNTQPEELLPSIYTPGVDNNSKHSNAPTKKNKDRPLTFKVSSMNREGSDKAPIKAKEPEKLPEVPENPPEVQQSTVYAIKDCIFNYLVQWKKKNDECYQYKVGPVDVQENILEHDGVDGLLPCHTEPTVFRTGSQLSLDENGVSAPSTVPRVNESHCSLVSNAPPNPYDASAQFENDLKRALSGPSSNLNKPEIVLNRKQECELERGPGSGAARVESDQQAIGPCLLPVEECEQNPQPQPDLSEVLLPCVLDESMPTLQYDVIVTSSNVPRESSPPTLSVDLSDDIPRPTFTEPCLENEFEANRAFMSLGGNDPTHYVSSSVDPPRGNAVTKYGRMSSSSIKKSKASASADKQSDKTKQFYNEQTPTMTDANTKQSVEAAPQNDRQDVPSLLDDSLATSSGDEDVRPTVSPSSGHVTSTGETTVPGAPQGTPPEGDSPPTLLPIEPERDNSSTSIRKDEQSIAMLISQILQQKLSNGKIEVDKTITSFANTTATGIAFEAGGKTSLVLPSDNELDAQDRSSSVDRECPMPAAKSNVKSVSPSRKGEKIIQSILEEDVHIQLVSHIAPTKSHSLPNTKSGVVYDLDLSSVDDPDLSVATSDTFCEGPEQGQSFASDIQKDHFNIKYNTKEILSRNKSKLDKLRLDQRYSEFLEKQCESLDDLNEERDKKISEDMEIVGRRTIKEEPEPETPHAKWWRSVYGVRRHKSPIQKDQSLQTQASEYSIITSNSSRAPPHRKGLHRVKKIQNVSPWVKAYHAKSSVGSAYPLGNFSRVSSNKNISFNRANSDLMKIHQNMKDEDANKEMNTVQTSSKSECVDKPLPKPPCKKPVKREGSLLSVQKDIRLALELEEQIVKNVERGTFSDATSLNLCSLCF